ncbi:hypothetical protein KAW38_01335 [Candidatus Micrarchaeota archaeon]|nr:hypothetical protein [Candidatus Micrarchaeota archaeon]
MPKVTTKKSNIPLYTLVHLREDFSPAIDFPLCAKEYGFKKGTVEHEVFINNNILLFSELESEEAKAIYSKALILAVAGEDIGLNVIRRISPKVARAYMVNIAENSSIDTSARIGATTVLRKMKTPRAELISFLSGDFEFLRSIAVSKLRRHIHDPAVREALGKQMKKEKILWIKDYIEEVLYGKPEKRRMKKPLRFPAKKPLEHLMKR